MDTLSVFAVHTRCAVFQTVAEERHGPAESDSEGIDFQNETIACFVTRPGKC